MVSKLAVEVVACDWCAARPVWRRVAVTQRLRICRESAAWLVILVPWLRGSTIANQGVACEKC
jgi:hypothetical protein